MKKALTEHGDKISDDEKSKIEAAMKAPKKPSRAATRTHRAKSQAWRWPRRSSAKMYAQAQARRRQLAGAGAAASRPAAKADDADVVDAVHRGEGQK